MFRIRFHGRGGQGIKTAGQILGTAFFHCGGEVQDAPRYGAERRGAPISAYVRADSRPIQERGIITRPDLVIVADETLISVPAAGVLDGLRRDTVLLIHSGFAPEHWGERLNHPCGILCLAATAGDADTASSHSGAVCAGAAARLVGVIPRTALEQALDLELVRLGAAERESNRAQALAAFDAMAAQAGKVKEGADAPAADYTRPEWITLGAEAASLASPQIDGAATSEKVFTSVWRTLRPVIDYGRCSRCAWICGSLCPDGAIAVAPDHTPSIDYEHCKGCLVCVAVCPPHAISAVPETAALAAERKP